MLDCKPLRPGDSIVVPVNSQHKESLAQWREITQILYQSLVSAARLLACRFIYT